jgi:hypothetical protein
MLQNLILIPKKESGYGDACVENECSRQMDEEGLYPLPLSGIQTEKNTVKSRKKTGWTRQELKLLTHSFKKNKVRYHERADIKEIFLTDSLSCLNKKSQPKQKR